MHAGDELPSVLASTPMREAIYEMSRKKLGITAVVDEDGKLLGCISDGDLRRLLEKSQDQLRGNAGEALQGYPQTIGRDELASAALRKMEEHRITSLFVCGPEGALEGVVHLHDLWRLELF